MVVGQVASQCDLLVVGAGPGGYEAALHAARLGMRVTLVDAAGLGGLGGECLHRGCIPSKVLIEHAERVGHQQRIPGRPVDEDPLLAFQSTKAAVVEPLRSGIEGQLKAAGVETVHGVARFMAKGRAVVDRGSVPPEFFEYRDAIVASGSRPVDIPTLATDGDDVLDSAGVLALNEVPKSLAVIGGGYVGVELGTAMAKLGASVTIVEAADQLLPTLDRDLADVVAASLASLGVTVELVSTAIGHADATLQLRRQGTPDEVTAPAERVLVAVGRRPNTDELGLELVGAKIAGSGHISTDEEFRAAPNLFAIGDVRDGAALAHKATAEGRTVAEITAGIRARRDVGAIPLIVFSDPEVVSIGATARDAEASGGELIVGKATTAASGRAATLGLSRGFVRVVAAQESGVVLGVQMALPHASELSAAALLAIELGATLDDLDSVAFGHPTLSELLALAARSAARRQQRRVGTSLTV